MTFFYWGGRGGCTFLAFPEFSSFSFFLFLDLLFLFADFLLFFGLSFSAPSTSLSTSLWPFFECDGRRFLRSEVVGVGAADISTTRCPTPADPTVRCLITFLCWYPTPICNSVLKTWTDNDRARSNTWRKITIPIKEEGKVVDEACPHAQSGSACSLFFCCPFCRSGHSTYY